METGDYSIKGMEKLVTVERKSVHDLVNTLMHSKKRFSAEMDRIRLYPDRALVVEGSMYEIYKHQYHSKVHPNAVMGIINYIAVSTGVQVVWADDPIMAAWWMESWFRQIIKREERNASS